MPDTLPTPAPPHSPTRRGTGSARAGGPGTRPGKRLGAPWLAGGVLLGLLGAVLLVRADIALRRAAFESDARVVHRQLSQHAAQLDAVLSTLVLLAPGGAAAAGHAPDAETRLPALWPSVLQAWRRGPGQAWPDPAWADAEARSRAQAAPQRHAALAAVDAAQGHYTLVLAGDHSSYALRIDARRLVPAEGWPLADNPAVRLVLALGGKELVLRPGPPDAQQPAGLTPGFRYSKRMATDSQPFEVQLQRATGPAQWPWAGLLAWAAACAAGTAAALALQRARLAQRRSAELMRMQQVARLNSLGELAAGMAHELNQPLAALLASTQAAQRLLQARDPDTGAVAVGRGGNASNGSGTGSNSSNGSDAGDHATGHRDPGTGDHGPGHTPPDLAQAQQALALAAQQARRAADVVSRLRRLVQDPTRGLVAQPVDLQALAQQLLQLLAPELQRRGVQARVQGQAPWAWADAVAVEQVVHNLVNNALQALQAAATPAPTITLLLQAHGTTQAVLQVRDNGPGVAADASDRVFEPFFSTHAGGLGLGLPLCQSLAQAMGGELQLLPAHGPPGATFQLTLPTAAARPQAPLHHAR